MDLFFSMFARVRKAKKNVCRERRAERKGAGQGALCETINNESLQKIAVINFPPSAAAGLGKTRPFDSKWLSSEENTHEK